MKRVQCEACLEMVEEKNLTVFRHADSDQVVRVCILHPPEKWKPIVNQVFKKEIEARTQNVKKKPEKKKPAMTPNWASTGYHSVSKFN